jgi:hypothetical protein
MIAPSGSGKSWIVRNILYEMKDIPCGTVIAPTDKMNKFFDEFLPSAFIHHDYKHDIIPPNKLLCSPSRPFSLFFHILLNFLQFIIFLGFIFRKRDLA